MTGTSLSIVCDEVAQQLGINLSSGYIGNCGAGFDDRTWYVWFPDFPKGLDAHTNNTPSMAIGNTGHLAEMSESLLIDKIIARHERLCILRADRAYA